MKQINLYCLLLLSAFCCSVGSVRAQEEIEYKYELGGMAGVSCYYGDANLSSVFKDPGFMGGVMGRYNINQRMAVKGNFAVARISGNSEGGDYKLPGGDAEFSRTLFDLSAQFEYNFFAYGTGGSYKGSRRFTPYIFGGLGVLFAPKPADNVFTVHVPIGVGVKYKLMPRLNVGCELSFRMSMSDKLDVTQTEPPLLDDPYGIDSGFFKNRDSYSFLSIFVTYDLSPKYRRCNN